MMDPGTRGEVVLLQRAFGHHEDRCGAVRDLRRNRRRDPTAFGDWNSVFRRFSRWSQKGVWRRMFEAMSDDPDFEYLIVDSTIVRAHQHASGAKRGLRIRPSDGRAAA